MYCSFAEKHLLVSTVLKGLTLKKCNSYTTGILGYGHIFKWLEPHPNKLRETEPEEIDFARQLPWIFSINKYGCGIDKFIRTFYEIA